MFVLDQVYSCGMQIKRDINNLKNHMNYVKQLIGDLQHHASIAIALLNALDALERSDKLYVGSGKLAWMLDFTEEIEMIRSILICMNVDPAKAMRDRAEGTWF